MTITGELARKVLHIRSWLPILVAYMCATILSPHCAIAQQAKPFEPLSIDRPDVSNLPVTVHPHQYQFELGTEFVRGPATKEFYVPNLVFRTGLNKNSELRIGFNQLRLDSLVDGVDDNVLFLSIGGKYRFIEEDGWIPAIAIQPEFSLPFGEGPKLHQDEPNYSLADFSLILLFNNSLHEKVFVNYNAGLFWSKNDRVDYLLSVSTSFLHTHRLGYFLEAYSLIAEDDLPLSLDGGLMFLVSPRFQLDAYVGNRSFDGQRSWYGGAGIGFRLDQGDLRARTFKETGIHK